MKTNKRLDEAYSGAQTMMVDEDTKLIFFSDVHRGDNSMSDEFAHNQNIYFHALSKYLEEGYTYVELGDGDELWEHAKFKDIRGAHSDVFCLLREFYQRGRFHMLFGNHNMAVRNRRFVEKNMYRFYDEYLDKQSELFPGLVAVEAIRFVYRKTGQEFLAVHGHQGDLFNDQLWWISMFSLRNFWRYMHTIGLHNPASPAKNRVKRHKIEVNFSRWIRDKDIAILCGHTHRPKFPKGKELPYFNTGCCIHPRGINGIEIRDGQIMLIDWRIRPQEDGQLVISKKVIRGPVPLERYTRNKTKRKGFR
ncbi:metallophosphoesterase [Anaerotalea alkaliphila]|uniref:metallophosphoesterase n=1 Tax=Anaerotalea alkaliphila TaxID=2662126 RepID=UPI001FE41639|nr:metallophosphoesterase [Anaerotalea alkaliphila]